MPSVRGRVRESADGLRGRRNTEAARRMRESAETELEDKAIQQRRQQRLALNQRPSSERPNNPETTDGGW